MDERVFVLDRVPQRHPNVSKEDATEAWLNAVASMPRLDAEPLEYVAIGPDARGRMLEVVAVLGNGCWIIKHAQTPPQERVKRELGLGRSKQ